MISEVLSNLNGSVILCLLYKEDIGSDDYEAKLSYIPDAIEGSNDIEVVMMWHSLCVSLF